MRFALLTTFLLACGGSGSGRVERTEPDPTYGCGDGVLEGDEACDDGNGLGGDGCTERCVVEEGTLESEPNDDPFAADGFEGVVHGGLPEADIDCWDFDAAECGAVRIRAVGACDPALVLSLVDPDGVGVASGTAGADGCAVLEPAVSPGADQTLAGTHAVCASARGGQLLPSYALELEVLPDAVGEPGADADDDGLADRCDPDRDGDGVDNPLDNCVDVPNGPTMAGLAVDDEGFIRSWLTLGPVTGTTTTGDCRPSDENTLGVDADAAPRIGDVDGGLTWIAWFDPDTRINFLDRYGNVSPDREAYAHVYVWSPDARSANLALGADDGVFSWVNGVQIHDVSSCQGTNVDQFIEPVSLLAGWNRLTVKVRDHGGGWGLYARFLDGAGDPMVDLELSLTPDGEWVDDQSDGDGDGVGDVCDETP